MDIFDYAGRDRHKSFLRSEQPKNSAQANPEKLKEVFDLTGELEALGQTSTRKRGVQNQVSTGKRGVHNQTSDEEVHDLTSSEDEYESSYDEGGAKKKRKTVQTKKKRKAETLTSIEWCQKLGAIAAPHLHDIPRANQIGADIHAPLIDAAMKNVIVRAPSVSVCTKQVTKAQFLTELFRHSNQTGPSVAALKAFCSHLMK